MTRKDLINFNIHKKWTSARIKFYEEQKETINRLSSILSDMPKGSKSIYDTEAETLTNLLDKINELIQETKNETIKKEYEIKEQLNKLDDKYGLLLYHHYILGDSIKYIAKEILHNEVKYTYRLRDKALEEFDKLNQKEKKKVESRNQNVI